MLVLPHGWTENWLQSWLQVMTQWKLVQFCTPKRLSDCSCEVQSVHGWSRPWRSTSWILPIPPECRKFYKYIAYFLFEVSVTNSFILFEMKNETKMCWKTFREKLALELIGDYCSQQRVGRGGSRYLPQLSVHHFPRKKLTSEKGKKKRKKQFVPQ